MESPSSKRRSRSPKTTPRRSTSEGDLREARGKAEGYIRGLVDAGHLSNDRIRDYKILSSIHRRRTLLSDA